MAKKAKAQVQQGFVVLETKQEVRAYDGQKLWAFDECKAFSASAKPLKIKLHPEFGLSVELTQLNRWVSFPQGEIDPEELSFDDEGYLEWDPDEDFPVYINIVEAMRDEPRFTTNDLGGNPTDIIGRLPKLDDKGKQMKDSEGNLMWVPGTKTLRAYTSLMDDQPDPA